MRVIIYLLLSWAMMSSAIGCGPKNEPSPTTTTSTSQNPFDNFLSADVAPADGFDFTVGDPDGKGSYTDKATGKHHDGWRAATRFPEKYRRGIHTGEAW